jgi:GNAT superfamily N-acetyltransferase
LQADAERLGSVDLVRRLDSRLHFRLDVTFEIIPAHDVPLAAQAATFTEAFRGYVGGPVAMDAAALGRFVHAQGIDLCYSRFAQERRGTMWLWLHHAYWGSFAPRRHGRPGASRRTGVARGLLRHLLDEARARGDRMMFLEVIEQNPPAYALYEKEGFRSLARLCGWRRLPGGATAELSGEFAEISLAVASQLPSAREFPDLPWQISRHAVAKLESARAFASDRALAVISDPTATGPIRVHAVSSRQALSAVLQRHLDREFLARPFFPESLGQEIFEPLGFTREPLTQWLMRFEF